MEYLEGLMTESISLPTANISAQIDIQHRALPPCFNSITSTQKHLSFNVQIQNPLTTADTSISKQGKHRSVI